MTYSIVLFGEPVLEKQAAAVTEFDTPELNQLIVLFDALGQGFETVMAQVAADALGVDYRRCRVIHGQTDRITFGMGAFASRVTVMTGEATRLAASAVRAKALAAAARAPMVADNTVATGLLQRPLDLGATASLYSLTKSVSGHSDVILGAVVLHEKITPVAMLCVLAQQPAHSAACGTAAPS